MDGEAIQTRQRRAFWNKIGNSAEGTTGREALQRFGLDWEPVIVPIDYKMNGTTMKSKNFRLLVNNKTGQDLCPISGTWQPLGNREFYNRANAAIEGFGGIIDRGGYLHGSKSSLRTGERCAFLISNEVPELAFALYDDHKEGYASRIVFYNHHNPGCGIGARLITIRYICINGMVSKALHSVVQASHTKIGVEDYRKVEKELQIYKDLILSQKLVMQELVNVPVSVDEARDHFINWVGDKHKKTEDQPIAVKMLEAIYDGTAAQMMNESLENVGADLSLNDYTNGTAYGVLQAVTAYETHLRGGFNSTETAIRSKVFSSANTSQKAYDSLTRLYVPQHLRDARKDRQQVGVSAF